MKKKTLVRGMLFAFLCCVMVLGFRENAKAETGAGNYYIKINKSTNVVTVYTKDDKPYTAFVCSAGSATPLGTYYTQSKHAWWLLDGPSYGQYVTQITGNYLFHSVWYYEQDKTTQSYVQYNRLGTLASHGCVRLTVSAVKWIYDNCPLQTKVIIFNGTSADDPLGKPAFIHVNSATSMGWDPTDPDPNNPYSTKNTQPKISVKSRTVKVQYKGKFTPVEMTAYDSAGNVLSNAWIRTSGTVNTKQMGSYTVTYSLTDSFGRDASATVTYLVGDATKATISGVRKEVTKEYNSDFLLRRGITAKNSLGHVLTDKIVTKIRKPGETEYKGVSADTLKLRYTGTYRIMYYLKNPTNNMVTKEYTKIIVKDTKKPVFASKDNFGKMELAAGTKSITYKKLVSGVSAKLVSGKNMTSKISVKVTDPAGKVKTVARNSSYSFSGAGTYTVTYYCSNTVKSLKTGKYLVAKKSRKLVVAEEEPEQNDPAQEDPGQNDPAQSGPTQNNPSQEDPAQSGQSQTDPSQPSTSQGDPAQSGQPQTDPSQPGTSQDNPSQTDPSQSGQSQEGPGSTAQGIQSVTRTISAPADGIVPAGTVIHVLEDVKVVTAVTMEDNTTRTEETAEGIKARAIYQSNIGSPEIEVSMYAGLMLNTADAGIYKIIYHYTDAQGNITEYVRTIIATPVRSINGKLTGSNGQ